MFKYSDDEFFADQQKTDKERTFKKIGEKCCLMYSSVIDEIFTNNKVTYNYLEEFTSLVNKNNEKITIVAITRNQEPFWIHSDLAIGFNAVGKDWDSTIPYIEYSFAEDYKCPYGPNYKHCFFLFFTKHHFFKDSEKYIIHYLDRINKLKVFL